MTSESLKSLHYIFDELNIFLFMAQQPKQHDLHYHHFLLKKGLLTIEVIYDQD